MAAAAWELPLPEVSHRLVMSALGRHRDKWCALSARESNPNSLTCPNEALCSLAFTYPSRILSYHPTHALGPATPVPALSRTCHETHPIIFAPFMFWMLLFLQPGHLSSSHIPSPPVFEYCSKATSSGKPPLATPKLSWPSYFFLHQFLEHSV